MGHQNPSTAIKHPRHAFSLGVVLLWASVLLASLLLTSMPARAGVAQVRKQVEASMLVTGMVYIAPDGSVQQLDLDQGAKLPPAVRSLIDQSSSAWRFEPHVVDGVAKLAKARMSLRVVAKQLESGDYSVQLRSAYFGKEALSADERIAKEGTDTIRSTSMKPPPYPEGAAIAGASGVAYLIVKIGKDGRVADAIVEQVNLQVLGNERVMDDLRKAFGKAALRAAKTWSFQVPTTGEAADDPYWCVRVPVAYKMMGQKEPGYGEWSVYVPGPKAKADWAGDDRGMGDADAMIAGGVYLVGDGVRLLTPLQSG